MYESWACVGAGRRPPLDAQATAPLTPTLRRSTTSLRGENLLSLSLSLSHSFLSLAFSLSFSLFALPFSLPPPPLFSLSSAG